MTDWETSIASMKPPVTRTESTNMLSTIAELTSTQAVTSSKVALLCDSRSKVRRQDPKSAGSQVRGCPVPKIAGLNTQMKGGGADNSGTRRAIKTFPGTSSAGKTTAAASSPIIYPKCVHNTDDGDYGFFAATRDVATDAAAKLAATRRAIAHVSARGRRYDMAASYLTIDRRRRTCRGLMDALSKGSRRGAFLSSCIPVDVFCERRFLTGIRRADRTLVLRTSDGVYTTDLVGQLPGYGEVWCHPGYGLNILAMQIAMERRPVTCDHSTGEVFVRATSRGTRRFRRIGSTPTGLYYSDFTSADDWVASVPSLADSDTDKEGFDDKGLETGARSDDADSKPGTTGAPDEFTFDGAGDGTSRTDTGGWTKEVVVLVALILVALAMLMFGGSRIDGPEALAGGRGGAETELNCLSRVKSNESLLMSK